MRRVKVTIIYKSGAKITLRCKSFSVSSSRLDGSITKLEWDDSVPRPLDAGVADVVAVWSRTVWRWWP